MANYTESDITTDEQAALDQVKEETEAAVKYDIAAKKAKDPVTKEAMEHNKKDEIEHAGLMGAVAVRENPENKEDMMNGVKELDSFLKKSISQCLKERRERGTTEIFQKAEPAPVVPGLERKDILLKKKLGEGSHVPKKIEYYGRTTGNNKAVDPQYLGNNPYGYFYNLDRVKEALFGKKGRPNSVDLGGSENFRDNGAISEEDKYTIDESLNGLTYPVADLDTIRKLIIKDAFANPPDLKDKKAIDNWVNNLYVQLANLSFDAMDGKIDGWDRYANLLMNVPGMSLKGDDPMASKTPAWGRRYFNSDYKRPADPIKGYNLKGSDKATARMLKESINRINDLKAMEMNALMMEDMANKEYAGLPQVLIDTITNKKNDVGKLLKKYLHTQLTDRVVQGDPREEIQNALRDGTTSSLDDLYNFTKNPPSYEKVFGKRKVKSQLDSAKSGFWTDMNMLGLYPQNNEEGKAMIQAIKEYQNARGKDDELDKFRNMVDVVVGDMSDIDLIVQFKDLVDNLDSGDTSKGYTPKTKPTNAANLATLYLSQKIGEQNRDKAARMLQFIKLAKGDPENEIPPNEEMAEKLFAIIPSEDKVNELEAKLQKIYDTSGGGAYDEGDEADFESINDRIYTDKDYKKLEDLVFDVQDASDPEDDPRLEWNMDAIENLDNPENADEEKVPYYYREDDNNAEKEAANRKAYLENLDPDVFSIPEDQINELGEDLKHRYDLITDDVSHDPKLADDMIRFIENNLGDKEHSNYGDLIRKLAKVREGDNYVMPKMYRDKDLPYVLARYYGLTDDDLEEFGIDNEHTYLDPRYEKLRGYIDSKGGGFNGLGMDMDTFYDLSGTPRFQNKAVNPKSFDMANLNADDINARLGAVMDEKGRVKIPGRIDISKLDPTAKKYNESVQAAKRVNYDLTLYSALPTKELANKVADSFRKFLSMENVWTADGPGFEDYKSARTRFNSDLYRDTESAKDRPWFNDQVDSEIDPKDISRGSTNVVHTLEGTLGWKRLADRAYRAIDTIFGDEALHEFPRAYKEKDLKNRKEGKEYDTTTTLASRLLNDMTGRGKGFVDNVETDNLIQYSPKNRLGMEEIVNILEPIAAKYPAASPEERAAMLLTIPGLPKEFGGKYTDEEIETSSRQSRLDSALAKLYGNDTEGVKEKIAGYTPAQIESLITDINGYAQDSGYWSPVLEDGKQSPDLESVIGFTERNAPPVEEVVTADQDTTSPGVNSPEIMAEEGKPKTDKFFGKYEPKKEQTPEALTRSLTSCTRVRIRSATDDQPIETGLTMKDIREPTPRTDANGSSVKKVGSSAVLKSTSELMRSMRRH